MAKNKPAPSSSEPWDRKVCNALVAIVANRREAKNRITDLVKQRKNLENEIDESGVDAEHAVDLVKTQRAIALERDRERWLADQLETVILDADQGKLFDEPIKTNITEKQLSKLAEEQAKFQFTVPCLGGVYRFTQPDGADFQGEVIGGGNKACRVTVHSAKVGNYARDEEVEIEYAKWKLEEIDVPKDALRVDQPQAGGAGEMKKAG